MSWATGIPRALQDLASGEVHLIGVVADPGPWYGGRCDAWSCRSVPAAARASRYWKPSAKDAVVSTTLGLEGIEAKSGRHVLVADTPEDSPLLV